MTAKPPDPACTRGSRTTATRVVLGDISLSRSSNFALKLNSKLVKPVALPPGRAKLATKPPATRFVWRGQYGPHKAADLLEISGERGGSAPDNVGVRCDQFRGVFTKQLGIACTPACMAAGLPVQLLQCLYERRKPGLAL